MNSKLKEFLKLIEEEQNKNNSATIAEDVAIPISDPIESVSKYAQDIGKPRHNIAEAKDNIESNRWADPLLPLDQKFVTFRDMNDHYGKFLQRIQQQMSTIGGGGETKFRRLDDIDTSTIGVNRHLAYRPSDGKFYFQDITNSAVIIDDDYTTSVANNVISVINLPDDDIGPVQSFSFNTTPISASNTPGSLSWNASENTLNLYHIGGVTQQIGQETFAYVRNRTGSTIANGTAVMFAGAEQGVTSRLLAAPMVGDGSFDTLYILGITTQDIADGDDGLVTIWGSIHEVDTSAWNVGDLLYVDPSNPGKLINIKPTAPNNVIPIAAVLKKDATQGEIFVRPTIEQQRRYGTFSSSISHTAIVASTAYPIPLNTTEFNSGVTINPGDTSIINFNSSGLYDISINTQAISTNSSTKSLWLWVRKNGIDIPYTSRIMSVAGSSQYQVLTVSHNISISQNDYLQIMWAVDDITLSLEAANATSFAPAAPSIRVQISQSAL